MNKKSQFKPIITKNDFEEHIVGLTYSPNAPLTGEWSYNSSTRSAHIKKGASSDGGYLELKLGYLYTGDTLKLSADFLQISGVNPQFKIERYSDEDYSKDLVVEGTLSSQNTLSFGNNKLKFCVSVGGYYTIYIGVTGSASSEFQMRGITCNIKTINIL